LALTNSEKAPGRLDSLLAALSLVYLAGLFLWGVTRFLFQDEWGGLYLLNALADVLFMPLPLALGLNLWLRRRVVWIGGGAAILFWLVLYGGLFVPRPAPAEAGDRALTVMTYNLLRYNDNTTGIIDNLRQADADLVALNELGAPMASAIEQELSDVYPHQILGPDQRYGGSGVISRYPLKRSELTLGGRGWVGQPMILAMDFQGQEVLVTTFHAQALEGQQGMDGINRAIPRREEQAELLAYFATTVDRPLIMLGDLNASPQNRPYSVITEQLNDVWEEAGWGFGHSFMGIPRSIFGIPLPAWFTRIDYIFYSDDWQAEKAWIGPWDGGSDHRPVMARLSLTG
jgi:vancomycin resistance protein VanJ